MKKFLLSLAVSAVTASTALCSVGSLAKAADNTPKIYVDLVYKTETQIEANIMFENVPPAFFGKFHLNVSNGWEIPTNDKGMMTIGTLKNGTIVGSVNSNNVCIVFMSGESNSNDDWNGRFGSFFVNKTSAYSETNPNISVYFSQAGNDLDRIDSKSGGDTISHFTPSSNEPIKLPIITRVAEYRIGDTDANGIVNASDATDVLVALRKNGGAPIKVSQIENNFKTFFPHATAPAAGDANCDGIISKDDANYILDNYSSSSTGGGYIGSVGSKAIYEYYNC